MAISFVETTGTQWNTANNNINGSTTKNNYRFFIGVVESYTGTSSENKSSIQIQIGVGNNGHRFNSGYWRFRYTVDGAVYEINDGINIATNGFGFYEDCKPITFRKVDNTSYRTIVVNNIPHNADGTRTINIKVEMYRPANKGYNDNDPGHCTAEGTFTLKTIPRYFSSTPKMSVSNITETSAKISWTTPETCANVQYKIGSSGSWKTVTTDANAKSGSFTVGNLTHNKSYTIYGNFKRRDSGLWTQTTPSVTFSTLSGAVSVTQFDVAVVDETSVNVTWNASHGCDAVWYSTNNGSSWVATSGSPTFKISGLSAGTAYNFKIRVRRSDTQELGVSGTVKKTTYSYPHVTTAPNFTIGDSYNISLYNPLKRSVAVSLISPIGEETTQITTKGTSVTPSTNANWLNYYYRGIPNAKSGTYKVRVVCSAVNRDTTVNGGTYSIIGTEKPILPDADYWDVNPNTIALTGNYKILVDNYSICRVSIPVASKAYSNHYANIIQYNASWGGKEDYITFSSDTAVAKDIDKSSGSVLTVKAVDSRGLSSDYVTKTISNIPYINSIINNVSTERKNGIEQETSLGLTITLWNGNWAVNDRANDIQKVAYMCKQKNASEWSQLFDITELFKTKASKRVTDEGIVYDLDTDDELYIHANGENNGFEIGEAYDIQVVVADGYGGYYIYEAIGNTSVTDGKVGMARYKDGEGNYHYGFGGMPDHSYTEKVYGNFAATGEIRGASLFDSNMHVCKTHNFGTEITDANELQKLGSGLYVGMLDTNVPLAAWYFIEQITASASTAEPYCIQRIWMLTSQQYTFTRKKMDGKWYQWTADDKDYYYSDETCVGIWIDGKPIYKNTFTGNTPSLSGDWQQFASLYNINQIIKIEGSCGTGCIPRYSNDNYYLDIELRGDALCFMGKGYSNQAYRVTVYYTKTTD